MTGGDHEDPPTDGGGSDRPAPPDPLDRLWLHPSELGRAAASPDPTTGDEALTPVSQGNGIWLTALGAGMLGAVATLALLALLGLLGPPDRATKPVAGAAADRALTDLAGMQTGRSIVDVRAQRPDGSWSRVSAVAVEPGVLATSANALRDVDASTIVVTRADGTSRRAQYVGSDPFLDVGVLEIDSGFVDTAAIEERTGVGERIAAVGASGEGQPWVSSGVVARLDAMQPIGGQLVTGLIETDANATDQINGGALVDGNGRVVGLIVNTTNNRALASPIGVVRFAAGEVRRGRTVPHGMLGISVRDADGVVVERVDPGGPAARAGLQPGMVIRKIEGRPIGLAATLAADIMRRHPNDTIRLDVRSGTESAVIKVTLAGRTADSPPAVTYGSASIGS